MLDDFFDSKGRAHIHETLHFHSSVPRSVMARSGLSSQKGIDNRDRMLAII